MAAGDAPEGEAGSFEGAVALNGCDGVFGAGGDEAAGGGDEWGDAGAVKADGEEKEGDGEAAGGGSVGG